MALYRCEKGGGSSPIIPGKIYGASWDGSSNPAWTRTDDAANFSAPSPAVNNGTGSSPFDYIMPWAGMVRVSDSDAGELVAIPKFYFKLGYATPSLSTKGLKIQISMQPFDGCQVSPAHMDRGDGKGERDVVYVGRYHCASDTTDKYKSKTGVMPLGLETRDTFRSGIHNLGTNIWQWDYATLITIQLLYLVEYANWNSQAVIGYGCSANDEIVNEGQTDSMQYHTGTTASSRTTYGFVQYRNIEGLWSNVFDWYDGIYSDDSNIYIIKNPSDFSDYANGTNVAVLCKNEEKIYAYEISAISGYTWFLNPSEVGPGSENIYVCSAYSYVSPAAVWYGGGFKNQRLDSGLFMLINNGVGANSANIGSRLMKLP